MHIDEILRPHRRCRFIAHTADLSALSVDVMVSAFKSYSALSRPAPILHIRQGSNERDSSSATARSSPVMLSAAKHLSAQRYRPFAAWRRDNKGKQRCGPSFLQS